LITIGIIGDKEPVSPRATLDRNTPSPRTPCAAAVGLVTGIFGGVIGFLVAKVLVERFAVAEGLPAGVLLVFLSLVPSWLARLCHFILAFWRLRKATRKSTRARCDIDSMTMSAPMAE